MSFRRRVTIASAAAVAVAVALASALTYVLVRNELRGQVDSRLRNTGEEVVGLRSPPGLRAPTPAELVALIRRGRPPFASPRLGRQPPRSAFAELFYRRIPQRPGQAATFGQLITAQGQSLELPPSGAPALPITAPTLAVARQGSGTVLFDATVNGQAMRVLTRGLKPGSAVELARSLTDVNSVLSNIRLVLILVACAGIALAAVLGRFVAGAVVLPVRRLTAAAEHVTQTRDLGQRIDSAGRRDELGSLATSFNEMLGTLDQSMRALDESARSQRQLVADASHELRTPVTSLRTNIEILQRADSLPAVERERLIGDVVEQLEELSTLIGDLIELAREEERHEPVEELRFDMLVSEAIDRTQRHAPRARFDAALEETVVDGVPARLDRAVKNLLDNAVKFAGTNAPIEVQLRDGELTVRDHGPGIDPQDLPHVFDRFYRGARARALPGSGLGLAIVRQVAEWHAGSVSAEPAPGGGTILRLRLPTL